MQKIVNNSRLIKREVFDKKNTFLLINRKNGTMKEIKKIIAVLNDFETADAVLLKSLILSKEQDVQLEIIFVHEEAFFKLPDFFRFKKSPPEETIDTKKIREEIADKVVALGNKEGCPILVFIDDTADRVLVQTQDEKETIIVISYHKKIAKKLIKQSHLPILIIKNNHTENYEKIVVPVDFSLASKESIVLAKTLFPTKQIELVHDYRTLDMEGFMDSEGLKNTGIELINIEKKDAEDNFEALLQEMQCKGYFITEKTSPKEDLSDFIQRNGNDLAVIGSNNANKLFFDSVSFDLLETLLIDLLIYAPQPEKLETSSAQDMLIKKKEKLC